MNFWCYSFIVIIIIEGKTESGYIAERQVHTVQHTIELSNIFTTYMLLYPPHKS